MDPFANPTPTLVQNWNEMLKVGWERNFLIEKLTLKELALARLTFPNIVPCIIGIFFNLVKNDGESFVSVKIKNFHHGIVFYG